MFVDPINANNDHIHPYYANHSPSEAAEKIKTEIKNENVIKKREEESFRDSIASAVSAYCPSPILDLINRIFPNAGFQPKIPEPTHEISQRTLFSNSNNHLIHEVEKDEIASELNNLSYTEAELLKQVFLSNLEQKNLTEQEGLILYQAIEMWDEIKKDLGKEKLAYIDELMDRGKTSEKLAWVSWVFTGAVIGGGIASAAITFGTSLPAVFASWLAVGTALASVGSGSVKIAQGFHNYQTDQTTGELKKIDFQRNAYGDKINISMEEMKKGMELVISLMQQISTILNNQQEAQASMMK